MLKFILYFLLLTVSLNSWGQKVKLPIDCRNKLTGKWNYKEIPQAYVERTDSTFIEYIPQINLALYSKIQWKNGCDYDLIFIKSSRAQTKMSEGDITSITLEEFYGDSIKYTMYFKGFLHTAKMYRMLSGKISSEEASLYCSVIDTIIFNAEHKISNEYLTNHISKLTELTGIKSNARNGTAGTLYDNDSIFYSDMNKFKKALRCNENTKR